MHIGTKCMATKSTKTKLIVFHYHSQCQDSIDKVVLLSDAGVGFSR